MQGLDSCICFLGESEFLWEFTCEWASLSVWGVFKLVHHAMQFCIMYDPNVLWRQDCCVDVVAYFWVSQVFFVVVWVPDLHSQVLLAKTL